MSSVHRSGEGGDVVLGRVSFVTRGDVADGADGGEGIPSAMVPRGVARRFGDGIMRMAGIGWPVLRWWDGGHEQRKELMLRCHVGSGVVASWRRRGLSGGCDGVSCAYV